MVTRPKCSNTTLALTHAQKRSTNLYVYMWHYIGTCTFGFIWVQRTACAHISLYHIIICGRVRKKKCLFSIKLLFNNHGRVCVMQIIFLFELHRITTSSCFRRWCIYEIDVNCSISNDITVSLNIANAMIRIQDVDKFVKIFINI